MMSVMGFRAAIQLKIFLLRLILEEKHLKNLMLAAVRAGPTHSHLIIGSVMISINLMLRTPISVRS